LTINDLYRCAALTTFAAVSGASLLASLQGIKKADGSLAIPNSLTLVTLPDQSQAWVNDQQKQQLPSGFLESGIIALDNAKSQIEIPLNDGSSHVLVLGEALGLFVPHFQPLQPGFDPGGMTSELTAPELCRNHTAHVLHFRPPRQYPRDLPR
jgi:hypothetical protein